MVVTLGYVLGTLVAGALMLYKPVRCGETFRSSHVELHASCRLAESTNHTMLDSADCKYACLAKQNSGGCAAYQWVAETRTCHLQETLNVTASSCGDTVGVMVDTDEHTTCSDDTDCPLYHVCHVIDSGCGTLRTMCIARPRIGTDCAAILAADPTTPSGVYYILAGTQNLHSVWCDMDTDGGGWTVFLKRLDGSVDFYQDLATYKQGFGEVSGEYWLGLDVLHVLTSAQTYQLRADISDWEGASVYSLHQSMVVAGESDNYRLTLGAFTGGEAGDALSRFHTREFSTRDADRDVHSLDHCAQKYHGGFWYGFCFEANPTGRYYSGGVYSSSIPDGVQWRTWSIHNTKLYSMKTIELKLRP